MATSRRERCGWGPDVARKCIGAAIHSERRSGLRAADRLRESCQSAAGARDSTTAGDGGAPFHRRRTLAARPAALDRESSASRLRSGGGTDFRLPPVKTCSRLGGRQKSSYSRCSSGCPNIARSEERRVGKEE